MLIIATRCTIVDLDGISTDIEVDSANNLPPVIIDTVLSPKQIYGDASIFPITIENALEDSLTNGLTFSVIDQFALEESVIRHHLLQLPYPTTSSANLTGFTSLLNLREIGKYL